MTEQQYRVIKDRDKGDDPTYADAQPGDRITLIRGYTSTYESADPVRIERPVPTADEIPEADATPDEAFELGEVRGYDKGYADGLAECPSVPTREQVAEALYLHWRKSHPGTLTWDTDSEWRKAEFYGPADAVLALIQKGTDR